MTNIYENMRNYEHEAKPDLHMLDKLLRFRHVEAYFRHANKLLFALLLHLPGVVVKSACLEI